MNFMGLYLRSLERTPDKREVGGSSPPKPTKVERPDCTLKTEYTMCKTNFTTKRNREKSERIRKYAKAYVSVIRN